MNITRYTFSIALLLSSAVSTVSAHTDTCSHSCKQDSSDSKKIEVTTCEVATTKKTTIEETAPVAPKVETTVEVAVTKTAPEVVATKAAPVEAPATEITIEDIIKDAGLNEEEAAELRMILEDKNAVIAPSEAVTKNKDVVVADTKAAEEAIAEVAKTTI